MLHFPQKNIENFCIWPMMVKPPKIHWLHFVLTITKKLLQLKLPFLPCTVATDYHYSWHMTSDGETIQNELNNLKRCFIIFYALTYIDFAILRFIDINFQHMIYLLYTNFKFIAFLCIYLHTLHLPQMVKPSTIIGKDVTLFFYALTLELTLQSCVLQMLIWHPNQNQTDQAESDRRVPEKSGELHLVFLLNFQMPTAPSILIM